ncbi:hypothetical protein SprV_0301219100 [Sparganum proliferum]
MHLIDMTAYPTFDKKANHISGSNATPTLHSTYFLQKRLHHHPRGNPEKTHYVKLHQRRTGPDAPSPTIPIFITIAATPAPMVTMTNTGPTPAAGVYTQHALPPTIFTATTSTAPTTSIAESIPTCSSAITHRPGRSLATPPH